MKKNELIKKIEEIYKISLFLDDPDDCEFFKNKFKNLINEIKNGKLENE